jgi:putative transcriptional regulator
MKNKIKLLRVESNLTQEELSKLVGVRRETIVFLEKNQYNPSLLLSYKISKVFNLSIEEVFDFEDEFK